MFRTYLEIAKYAFIVGGGFAAGTAVVKGAQAAATKGITLLQLARSGSKGGDAQVNLDDNQDTANNV